MSNTIDGANTNTRETATLISAEKVRGTSVFNRAGEQLGTIQDIMLDKRRGQVGYAVMSFGGFLGFGEKYHPLPWHLLAYDETLGGYVIDIDRSVLEGAPAYEDARAWNAPEYGNDIDSYYAGDPATI